MERILLTRPEGSEVDYRQIDEEINRITEGVNLAMIEMHGAPIRMMIETGQLIVKDGKLVKPKKPGLLRRAAREVRSYLVHAFN